MPYQKKLKAIELADILENHNPSAVVLSLAAAELRRLDARVQDLAAVEEGAKIAFGDIVDAKRELEKQCESYSRNLRYTNESLKNTLIQLKTLTDEVERIRLSAAARDQLQIAS